MVAAEDNDDSKDRVLGANIPGVAKLAESVSQKLSGTAQLEHWANKGKTVGDIFNLLKLNGAQTDILKSPLLKTWFSYAAKLDENNPFEFLFQQLMKHLDDEGLSKMIVAPKFEPQSQDYADKLEGVLFKTWLKSGKTEDDVFKLLGLNAEEGGKLFKNRVLMVWESYVTKLDQKPYEILLLKLKSRLEKVKANTVFKTSMWNTWSSFVTKLDKENQARLMFKTLKAHYGDEGVRTVINGGRSTRALASPLTHAQVEDWLLNRKPADETFEVLGLGKISRDKLFQSPMWNTWSSYVNALAKGGGDELIYMTLLARYGEDDVAVMVAVAKGSASTKPIGASMEQEIFRSKETTADDMFNLMHLDNADTSFFGTSAFDTWMSYVKKLNNGNKKNPDESIVISELSKRYANAELARMLNDAKVQAWKANNKQTLKLTNKLQTL